MNRAFLIILIPAVLVAAGYVLLIRMAGVQLTYFRFIMAGVVIFAAVGVVHYYLRRHPRRRKL